MLSLSCFAVHSFIQFHHPTNTGKCLRAHGHYHRDGLGIPCCFLPKGTQLCCVCSYAVRRAGIEATFPSSLVPDEFYRAINFKPPGTYATADKDRNLGSLGWCNS